MALQLQKDQQPAAPVAAKAEATAKAKENVKAEMPVNDEGVKEFGQLADKLEFLNCLGDPSNDDVTGDRKDPTIVGYRFKALVDMSVPQVAPGVDFKKNLMSYDLEELKASKELKVKAGQTIDLTKFETGLLLSRPEFNGRVLGGKTPVTCSYTIKGVKDSSGKLLSTTEATSVPSISLRGLTGSVKDVKFIDVLTFEKTKNAAGATRKIRTIVAGFEKWIALTKDAVRVPGAVKGGVSAAEDHKTTRNQNAQAFLQIVNSKKATK